MKTFIATAIVLGLAAPVQAEVFNGFRIGAQAGIETETTDTAATLATSGLGAVSVDKKTATGGTVGVTLGYDASVFENFVVGAEIAGTYSTGRNRQVATFASAPGNPVTMTYKSTFTFEATVRAGVKVGDSTLLYARGGFATRKLDVTISTAGTAPTTTGGDSSGWLIGAGIEQAFGPKLSGRLEYRYFNFEGPSSRQQVVVGLGYSF